MTKQWLFLDPPNVAVFTTEQVIDQVAPILVVCHDADDGAWQFHTSLEVGDDEPKGVALHRVLALDSSLEALHDLPLGWCAVRGDEAAPWVRYPASGALPPNPRLRSSAP